MTNDETRMTNEISNANVQTPPPERDYDLEERTAKFGEWVIRFTKAIPVNPVTGSLISQVVRSGTSVGANYCEANDVETKKVFRQKIATCRKEAKETKHWLRMLAVADENTKTEARKLWQEAKELNLIFSTIHRNSRI
ncbi:MAG: four helix bundle protein [Phycisphaeraceae bacterium]